MFASHFFQFWVSCLLHYHQYIFIYSIILIVNRFSEELFIGPVAQILGGNENNENFVFWYRLIQAITFTCILCLISLAKDIGKLSSKFTNFLIV